MRQDNTSGPVLLLKRNSGAASRSQGHGTSGRKLPRFRPTAGASLLPIRPGGPLRTPQRETAMKERTAAINPFAPVSMVGRTAYIIMCVEKFLLTQYPDRNWTPLAEILWKATSENWGSWTDEYCGWLPDVLLQYPSYETIDFKQYMSREQYEAAMALYAGITEGREDDPTDPLSYMLAQPFEMATVYENTCIGDGHESLEILRNTRELLLSLHITPPDTRKVLFSRFTERDGWGYPFDGRFLSIILNREDEP